MKNIKSICLIVFCGLPFLTFGQTYAVDVTFNSGNSGVQGVVKTSVIQPDGKIIICGVFNSYNGVTRKDIARLNADGSLDLTFDPGSSATSSTIATIQDVALDANGKIIVVGTFTSFNGVARRHIARLNSNGSVDTSFSAGNLILSSQGIGDPMINTVKVKADGKILIGGKFRILSSPNPIRYCFAGLDINGTLDTTFVPTTNQLVDISSVNDIQFQSDNKIIVALTSGFNRAVLRFNANGTFDTTFIDSGYVYGSFSVLVLPDDKLIVGGFLGLLGENGADDTHRTVIKLNANGSLDNTFSVFDAQPSASSNAVRTVKLFNNKILIGGNFSAYGGVNTNQIARLNLDGTVDESFVVGTGANNTISDVNIDSTNKIFLSGNFSSFNSTPVLGFARLTEGNLSIGDINSVTDDFSFINEEFQYVFNSDNIFIKQIDVYDPLGKKLQVITNINSQYYLMSVNFVTGVKIIKVTMADGSIKTIKTID